MADGCSVVYRWKDTIFQERLDVLTKLRAEGSALISMTCRAGSMNKGWILAPVSAYEKLLREHLKMLLTFLVEVARGSRRMAARSHSQGIVLLGLKFPES